ncbi:MAG: acyl-CoA synthetase [Alphaproteobacteria bacterium]|nr:acyl-CoA synthetase [Alphaproteobacteria bacterium]
MSRFDLFSHHRNDNGALFCGGRNASWGEFVTDVARAANYFSRIQRDTVILYVPNDMYLFCVCFMGLIQANKAVALPGMLTPTNAPDLADLTNVIVTDAPNDFPGFEKIELVIDGPDDWNFTDISNGVIYFFTSGSTGKPKRIRKTLAMLLAEVSMHTDMHAGQIEQSPVVIASIAPHHMYGLLWRVLFPMLAELRIDTDIIFTPEELINRQSTYNKILFLTTPSFLDSITRYNDQYKFADNCIGIFTSGSLLNHDTSGAAYKMFGTSPFEVFGSTETGGVAYRQQAETENWTIFSPINVWVDDNRLTINSAFSFMNPYLMSDAVEMLDDAHFKLLGRADRIVKIAEERISLPDMETKLGEHDLVARAYCCAVKRGARDVVGCMLEPTVIGAEYIVKNGRRAFVDIIKKHLAEFVPAVTVPKIIRIVNQIPTNTQGKFIKNEIVALMQSGVVEPIMQNAKKTNEQFVADLTFLGDSAYFTGHFTDCPILPGVIQLHFVFMYIRQFFHLDAATFDVIKLKFTALILPNTLTHFELVRLNEHEFSFCYSQNGQPCSAGKVNIRGTK